MCTPAQLKYLRFKATTRWYIYIGADNFFAGIHNIDCSLFAIYHQVIWQATCIVALVLTVLCDLLWMNLVCLLLTLFFP
jgi:hypothetical protein